MKKWKCKDCCCFQTLSCQYPSAEDNDIACECIVVDHDKAYKMGYADGSLSVTEEIMAHKDKEIRAKVVDEVRNALLEKADYMETEEGFYGKVVTEKEIEEVIENLKEQK